MSDNNSVIREAKTVPEAIELGLKMLGIKKDQAYIQVLDKGKKGIMGLGSKPAKVRVVIKEVVAAENQLKDLLADLEIHENTQIPKAKLDNQLASKADNQLGKLENQLAKVDNQLGTVEIKDGKLTVVNPQLEGKLAQIEIGEHVRLLVNGQEIEGATNVTEEDQIYIEIIDDEPVSKLELTLSEDKLEAYLKLVNLPGAKYKLMDQSQTNSLMLITEVSEIVELPPVDLTKIKKYLKEQGVIKGIIDDSLQEVINNTNLPEKILVARGQLPQSGIDAYIRYPYEENREDDEEEGLFGRSKLISVTQDEIIAVKMPSEPGQDGWTVTGEVLAPKQPAECELSVKNGCQLSEDGQKVIAEINGRPVTETVGNINYVSVDPIYEVKEVDNKTGDIHFKGDVQVQQNVGEGFTIEASGNIEILGDVSKGTVKAGANVTIHKMVFGSHIIAGGKAALYSSIMHRLQNVRVMLETMFTLAEQLKDSAGFKSADLLSKGDGPLIRLLVDSKFGQLPRAISEIRKIANHSKIELHDEFLDLVDQLTKSLCGHGPIQLEKIEFLQVLQKNVEEIILFISGYMKEVVNLKVRYVQNSTLICNGDILIEGEGAYISTITAGGEVIITGKVGIARGTVITAHKDVTVKELGSDFDTQTSVKIIGQGKITAELVHPNVKIQIDNEVVRVDKTYRNFTAFINNEGKLIQDGLQA